MVMLNSILVTLCHYHLFFFHVLWTSILQFNTLLVDFISSDFQLYFLVIIVNISQDVFVPEFCHCFI